MKNLIAQAGGIPLSPGGNGFKGIGTGVLSNVTDGIGTFTTFISMVIGVMTIVAIVWFVISFFLGVIGIIGAGADKGAMESAKKKISSALIGLVVVIIAIGILNLVGYILGLPNILDLPTLFTNLF